MGILLKCGCRANSTNQDGKPSCAIHDCCEEYNGTADFSKRIAECCYCGKTSKSRLNLPFFEFRGEGSPAATDMCKCGYHRIAHDPSRARACKGCNFDPHGVWETDRYYCGCRGWD